MIKKYRYDFIFLGIFVILSYWFIATSYRYQVSDWSDTNAMLAMGKFWSQGYVPFKDVFEQRGPLMYLLMLLATVIQPSSPLYGLYLLELVNFLGVYVLSKKIFALYFKKPWSISLASFLVILGIILNPLFFQGNSPEEWALIPTVWYAYLVIRVLKTDTVFTLSENLLSGFFIGFVFWLKYPILGIPIGLFLVVFIKLLLNKQFAKLFRLIGQLFGGFAVVTLPVLLYFVLVQGIPSLINGYFLLNFKYGATSNFISRILLMLLFAFTWFMPQAILTATGVTGIFILFSQHTFKNNDFLKTNPVYKKCLVLVPLSLGLFIQYWSAHSGAQYLLNGFVFGSYFAILGFVELIHHSSVNRLVSAGCLFALVLAFVGIPELVFPNRVFNSFNGKTPLNLSMLSSKYLLDKQTNGGLHRSQRD